MRKLREITPAHLRCLVGACPAVYETDDGRLLIIGKTLSPEAASLLPPGKVGPGEAVIEISRALIANLPAK